MTLTKIEEENLNIVAQDVSITIDKHFPHFDKEVREYMQKLVPFFVVLYFKILKHDAKNKDWIHADLVLPMNNIFNILKNILEVHTGYEAFAEILNHLKNSTYLKTQNSFFDAINIAQKENLKNKKHGKTFYSLVHQDEIIKNNHTKELEYIAKNDLHDIITFVFVSPIVEEDFSKVSQAGINFYKKEKDKTVVQDHKLNQKINNLGFDVLVINGSDMTAIDEAVSYAKSLLKPTAILLNIN